MKSRTRATSGVRGWIPAALLCSALSASALAGPEANPTIEVRQLRTGGSSFARLAAELGQLQLGEASLVALAPLKTQPESSLSNSDSAKLWTKVRSLVASAVPLTQQHAEKPLSGIEARTMARRSGLPLVYLEPRLADGQLALGVSVIRWPRSFWQRARAPQGAVSHRLELRVNADGAIRSLFPQPKKLLAEKASVPSPLKSPLSIACGEFENSGKTSIALSDRHEVLVGHWESERFIIDTRTRWANLSPVSPTPLRAPLGAMVFRGGRLHAGLSDRAHLVELDGSLEVQGRSDRVYPLPDDTCASFTATGISGRSKSCPPLSRDPSPVKSEAPASEGGYDAVASGEFQVKSGARVVAIAQVAHSSTEATVEFRSTVDGTRSLSLPNVGAALKWADLDGDGAPELITSTATRESKQDRLQIFSSQEGKLSKVADLAEGAVHAVGVCPFNGKNPLPLVAVVGDKLWVLR